MLERAILSDNHARHSGRMTYPKFTVETNRVVFVSVVPPLKPPSTVVNFAIHHGGISFVQNGHSPGKGSFMKRSLMCVALLLSTATFAVGQAPKLETLKQKASYAIGLNFGRAIARDNVPVDTALIAAGIADALSGAKPKLTDEEVQATMQELQKQMQARAEAELKEAGAKGIKEGEAFLAANKVKPGVKTLASGLQYKVIKSGTGATPKATDTVKTHYKGTLVDGTEFDSSYKRGEPATFPVNRVIPGWTEALQLMKEGDKWQLFIPSELAYGANGRPPTIGPSQTLLFDIELIEVQK